MYKNISIYIYIYIYIYILYIYIHRCHIHVRTYVPNYDYLVPGRQGPKAVGPVGPMTDERATSEQLHRGIRSSSLACFCSGLGLGACFLFYRI